MDRDIALHNLEKSYPERGHLYTGNPESTDVHRLAHDWRRPQPPSSGIAAASMHSRSR